MYPVSINVGEFAKPINTLIEKICSATGILYEPTKIKRNAKAQAEAVLVAANTNIKIQDLQRRAINRWAIEETRKQDNIEAIIEKTIPLLSENTSSENLEPDWLTNFFNKCRNYSDEEMQLLWSKILAEESNNTGSFSRRTINLLADLSKKDAELFKTVCRFTWISEDNDLAVVIFNTNDKIYEENKITFSGLLHLQALGLLSFNTSSDGFGLQPDKPNGYIDISYFQKKIRIDLTDFRNWLPVGKVLLTEAGEELSKICNNEPIEGFFEYATAKWLTPKTFRID